MKREKSIIYIGLLLLALFIGVSVFTFIQSNQQIRDGYLESEGNAAENFAVLTAANIKLSDKQVNTLKNYSYTELLDSKENKALRKMMDNDNFANKVDYAYVMMHLKDDEVKYKVNKENQSRFDAPLGTKLDIMWLLDVNVSQEAADVAKKDASSEQSKEIQRYSYYIDDDALIFGEAPTYLFNSSEWGDHICGYAPLYTTEGSYIGVVGVELQTKDFNSYTSGAMLAMGLLLLVSTLTLTALFVFLYIKYKKMQFEKIYTDSLTHISNRSYYNDRFIKHMNLKLLSGHYFALMIADIDWFKKVNDTFGHEIGDEVLVEIGEILLKTFGKEHVVRFGGEEFIVGLWIKDEASLRRKIDWLFEQIEEHRFSKRHIDVSISLGCSYSKRSEVNGWLMSEMLRAADFLLYESKENGRRQYHMEEFDQKKDYKKEK